MYIILVYDISNNKRGAKLLKYLREKLHWVQNSVFEGDLTVSGFEGLKIGISTLINSDEDSIIYYVFPSRAYSKRVVMGVNKGQTGTFL